MFRGGSPQDWQRFGETGPQDLSGAADVGWDLTRRFLSDSVGMVRRMQLTAVWLTWASFLGVTAAPIAWGLSEPHARPFTVGACFGVVSFAAAGRWHLLRYAERLDRELWVRLREVSGSTASP